MNRMNLWGGSKGRSNSKWTAPADTLSRSGYGLMGIEAAKLRVMKGTLQNKQDGNIENFGTEPVFKVAN